MQEEPDPVCCGSCDANASTGHSHDSWVDPKCLYVHHTAGGGCMYVRAYDVISKHELKA